LKLPKSASKTVNGGPFADFLFVSRHEIIIFGLVVTPAFTNRRILLKIRFLSLGSDFPIFRACDLSKKPHRLARRTSCVRGVGGKRGLSLEGVCSMLAASDGTMELDLSDIDELAGTCVIILRITASKAKASKGRSKIGPARANVDVAGLKCAQVWMSEDPSGSAESLKKKFVNKIQKQIEANQRSQKDDDDDDVAPEASAGGRRGE
jgi:hypothetical protein